MLWAEEMDLGPGRTGRAIVGLRIERMFKREGRSCLVRGEAEPTRKVPLSQVRLRERVEALEQVLGGLEADD